MKAWVLHVVVEELLKLLVDKVDGDLLEAIVLKDLKTGDVKHSAEVGLFESVGFHISSNIPQPTENLRGINKRVVTFDDQPLEHSVEDGTPNTANGSCCLLASLTWVSKKGNSECLQILEPYLW